MRFGDMSVEERLELLDLKTCQPLVDAKTTIAVAIRRFHESWTSYKTITPTLYCIRAEGRGLYLTLGGLRKSYGLSWDTLEAIVATLEVTKNAEGYLLAAEAINAGSEAVPHVLFGLQGHYQGERQYGALDLSSLLPYEDRFVMEVDLSPEAWQDLRLQALNNSELRPSR